MEENKDDGIQMNDRCQGGRRRKHAEKTKKEREKKKTKKKKKKRKKKEKIGEVLFHPYWTKEKDILNRFSVPHVYGMVN